jgi:DNA-binding NarL/FixJ family response regulator
LILHGGYARGRLMRGGGDALREEAQAMYKLAEIGWGKDEESFRQFFTSQFIPGGTREQHHWFNELERISTSPANAARMMRVFDSIDVVGQLAGVGCPTIVLHATRDLRVPFAEGRLIAGAIPQARFVPLDSANHLVLRNEDCWQHWHKEVDDFLHTLSSRSGAPMFCALTAREHELVELIAQGRDNSQIAAQLQLSEKTVRNHITSIFAKLQVENRAQAIVAARNAGYGSGASL